MVSRELHDERRRLAGKCLELLQHDAGNNDGTDADEVGGSRDVRGLAEDSAGDEADDRELRAARHEGRGEQGQLSVAVIFDRTGSHDTRDAAAGGHEARDEGLAGEAELAEDTVHDERDAGHVADILKDGQEQEEDEHLWYEAQDRADAGDDAVLNKSVEDAAFRDMECGKEAVNKTRNPFAEDHVVGEIRGFCAEGNRPAAHRDRVHEEHDAREDRETEDTVRDDRVDLVGHGHAVLLARLFDRLADDLADVIVSLVGDDALGIVVHGLLDVRDDGFRRLAFLSGELEVLGHGAVALEHLDRVPAEKAVADFAFQDVFDL